MVENAMIAMLVKKINIVTCVQLVEVCGSAGWENYYMRSELRFNRWWNFQQKKISLMIIDVVL